MKIVCYILYYQVYKHLKYFGVSSCKSQGFLGWKHLFEKSHVSSERAHWPFFTAEAARQGAEAQQMSFLNTLQDTLHN